MKDTLNGLAEQVTENFYVPKDPDQRVRLITEVTNALPASYADIARGFEFNLRGLIASVGFPYTMAFSGAVDRHFQRLSGAERIRALLIDADPGENPEELDQRRNQVVSEKARFAIKEFVATREGQIAIMTDCSRILQRFLLSGESMSLAPGELLLQGVVLCWSAFEVLARTCFVTILNKAPSLVDRLRRDDATRKRFDVARLPIEILIEHGFDLSRKMGDLLAEHQDLSDLNTIKAVYTALFPEASDLRADLSDQDLRLLSERRHLVVHRRGVIDNAYVKRTSCAIPLGNRLVITPGHLEDHLSTVIRVGSSLLSIAGATERSH